MLTMSGKFQQQRSNSGLSSPPPQLSHAVSMVISVQIGLPAHGMVFPILPLSVPREHLLTTPADQGRWHAPGYVARYME